MKKNISKFKKGLGSKRYRIFKLFCFNLLLLILLTSTSIVFAEDDPMTVVNNLSNFIFGLVRAIGTIILVFSIVQIGLSFKSHDPSQRANGFLSFAGGIIITFSKEILTMITGG